MADEYANLKAAFQNGPIGLIWSREIRLRRVLSILKRLENQNQI